MIDIILKNIFQFVFNIKLSTQEAHLLVQAAMFVDQER